jgi:hypothetical protein
MTAEAYARGAPYTFRRVVPPNQAAGDAPPNVAPADQISLREFALISSGLPPGGVTSHRWMKVTCVCEAVTGYRVTEDGQQLAALAGGHGHIVPVGEKFYLQVHEGQEAVLVTMTQDLYDTLEAAADRTVCAGYKLNLPDITFLIRAGRDTPARLVGHARAIGGMEISVPEVSTYRYWTGAFAFAQASVAGLGMLRLGETTVRMQTPVPGQNPVQHISQACAGRAGAVLEAAYHCLGGNPPGSAAALPMQFALNPNLTLQDRMRSGSVSRYTAANVVTWVAMVLARHGTAPIGRAMRDAQPAGLALM